MRHIFSAISVIVLFAFPWLAHNYPYELVYVWDRMENAGNKVASIILVRNSGKSVEEIKAKYDNRHEKIKILLVPGHEPDYGGTEYKNLKEREIVVDLAEELKNFLLLNPKYEVHVTRGKESWSNEFQSYFERDWGEITKWQQAHKEENQRLVGLGKIVESTPSVIHNNVPHDVAMRLYGVSRWVGMNDVDITLHLHFNDYPRKRMNIEGEYQGFAIYVPEKQLYNSTTTKAVAEKIFKRLEKFKATSDFPGEQGGIIEDQDLIAVGSYNSLNSPSMLIEYGYIYEPELQDEQVRRLALREMAYHTFLGVQDFFDYEKSIFKTPTSILPYTFRSNLTADNATKEEVFTLQTALIVQGVYPPQGKDKSDCPRTGTIGACTKAALNAFQEKYDIKGENGSIGPKTIEVLNSFFSAEKVNVKVI